MIGRPPVWPRTRPTRAWRPLWPRTDVLHRRKTSCVTLFEAGDGDLRPEIGGSGRVPKSTDASQRHSSRLVDGAIPLDEVPQRRHHSRHDLAISDGASGLIYPPRRASHAGRVKWLIVTIGVIPAPRTASMTSR